MPEEIVLGLIASILSPKEGAVLDTVRNGQGLTCTVRISEQYYLANRPNDIKKRPAKHQAFTVRVVQPNQLIGATDGETDEDGQGTVTFSNCRPGLATLLIYDDTKVNVTIAPNERQAITVKLDNQRDTDPAVPADGAKIKVPPDGALITITAEIKSPTKYVVFETSFDNFSQGTFFTSDTNGLWSGTLPLLGSHAPLDLRLRVRDVDFFGESRTTLYNLSLIDFTPPVIEIFHPVEDSEFYKLPDQKLTIQVQGRVSDSQSGYSDGSLSYTFAGVKTTISDLINGGFFEFYLTVNSYGPQRVILTAQDKVGNTTQGLVREFIVVSTNIPKSINVLLSPHSYLQDLIRFVSSHVINQSNAPVDSDLLSRTFMPTAGNRNFFGVLSDPGFAGNQYVVNELLPAVYLLRTRLLGLVIYLPFEDDLTSGYGLSQQPGLLHADGMIGKPGTDSAGTIQFTRPTDYLELEATTWVAEIGKDNADFSISFWLYLRGDTGGIWRSIVYKGTSSWVPTLQIWLSPDYKIRCSVSVGPGTIDLDFKYQLFGSWWTHVALVKSGASLELYVYGAKQETIQIEPVVTGPEDFMILGSSLTVPNSFLGALDEFRIYNFALSAKDIAHLASNRISLPPTKTNPLHVYVNSAYEALLVAYGTSREELSALPARGKAGRRTLAERLGLTALDPADDALHTLIPPSKVEDDAYAFEQWLSEVFGLPQTSDLLAIAGTVKRRGTLLEKRQDYLVQRWMAEDSANSRFLSYFLLDPDLIEQSDINPQHTAAVTLFAQRRQSLTLIANSLRQVVATSGVSEALQKVYRTEEISKLTEIESNDLLGMPVGDHLPTLGLTILGFRRLRFYQGLPKLESQSEREDFVQLLTQAWKLRMAQEWRTEESTLRPPLWPTRESAGAFIAGNIKRDFLSWRSNLTDRLRFENLVTARTNVFQMLSDSHDQATQYAQGVALPLFRDQLLDISDLPSAFNTITENLLVDVASGGARTVTLISQATLMLQTLINGIRANRFSGGHPAAGWRLRTDWLDEPKNDRDLGHFDKEWAWMGDYASWRSAKRTYLYPENALFPELRTTTTTPDPITPKFQTFLEDLNNMAPAVPTELWMKERLVGMSHHEQTFFVWVAVGVMLERTRRYSVALDWYRKVYDVSKPQGDRATAPLLQEEKANHRPPYITNDDRWILNRDPHTNARRTTVGQDGKTLFLFRYPYTRFILSRISHCLVSWADVEFAMNTDGSRARALSLYIEANQILESPELDNPVPSESHEAILPNPDITALREHASSSLQKLRRGLTHLGTPAAPDLTPGSDGVSGLVRPTPYRYRVLIDRARHVITMTQNLEAQYLSALERHETEMEKLRREAGTAQIGVETVSLRRLQLDEAADGVTLAKSQKQRTQIQRDQYSKLLAAGETANERAQMQAIRDTATAKQVANFADTILAGAQAIQSMGGIADIITTVGKNVAATSIMTAAIATRGISQGFVIDKETTATLRGIEASQERRRQEWEHQIALANQDALIAQGQIDLAIDRTAIANQEYTIALVQQQHAQDMLQFLTSKFMNVPFYEWMIGVLAEVYAFLLRAATTMARQAEGQLAFERQQASANMIKPDYWTHVNQAGSSSAAPDRRGITASAQLLKDVTTLDQYAFETERRFLNLSHTFSLASLFPVDFHEFRRTGLMSFSTMMRQFDECFPGHYMRLIKKVRISFAALIPPNQGVRATLSTSGLSRVVTGDAAFPVLVVRQEPESVALTSPLASSGVFELDMQSDLLFPFEGMGVDTSWFLELPPAANPFDYNTLFDVVMTIDYTALNSYELRDRVIKQLPRRYMGERAFSVRRDLPDIWYDLANQASQPLRFALPLGRRDFPTGLTELAFEHLAVSVQLTDGQPAAFLVNPSFTIPQKSSAPNPTLGPTLVKGSTVLAIQGLASSRQSGGAIWLSELFNQDYRQPSTSVPWRFEFSDPADPSPIPINPIIQAFKDGKVDDILINFTYSGLKPAWH